jgi:hypothetical protein
VAIAIVLLHFNKPIARNSEEKGEREEGRTEGTRRRAAGPMRDSDKEGKKEGGTEGKTAGEGKKHVRMMRDARQVGK